MKFQEKYLPLIVLIPVIIEMTNEPKPVRIEMLGIIVIILMIITESLCTTIHVASSIKERINLF